MLILSCYICINCLLKKIREMWFRSASSSIGISASGIIIWIGLSTLVLYDIHCIRSEVIYTNMKEKIRSSGLHHVHTVFFANGLSSTKHLETHTVLYVSE